MSSAPSWVIGRLIVVVVLLVATWSLGTLITPTGGGEHPVAQLASRCVSNPILQTVSCRPR